MRLTVHSDYALRVMMYLAARPERLATIEEIAAAYGISANHLMKVVHNLSRHAFIVTVRGRGGGMRLAKPPAAITVGDVLRKTEEDLALVECFRADNTCRITPACELRHALAEALDAYLDVLERWTLARLVHKPQRLTRLFAPEAKSP